MLVLWITSFVVGAGFTALVLANQYAAAAGAW